ncbi:unnamed protein product [Clonostachys rosea]|uniref:Uncharacterized protein n=1 Tax=Bionectria ochroleuca TaxID=29856 RepID=A0ABY6U371_BIOOC|nr:unnamed protein product [Clonostachys rosea]
MRQMLAFIYFLSGFAHAAFLRGNAVEVDTLNPLGKSALASPRPGYYNGWGTFDQLIDHSNPSLGTFKQRYWYGTQYWNGPGSPVVLVNSGERSAEGTDRVYLSDALLPGLFARELGAAVILMEHRYWGRSSPFGTLTTENLKYLTLDNSLKDIVNFAQTWVPDFDPSGRSSPQRAPWIYTGGSYAGALASWLASLYPGTFWAYHGSSSVVQNIDNFWQYHRPIQEASPQNCSRDLNKVVDYIDDTLLNGAEDEKLFLKARFKLEGLQDADFAAAIASGPWLWQRTHFSDQRNKGFNRYHKFCDYIENSASWLTWSVPGPSGVGLQKALEGYARWFTQVHLPSYCESEAGYEGWRGRFNTGCFDSLNASNPAYHDLTANNWANRQWNWMLCNEPFKWWQNGAPEGTPTIVSRLLGNEYWESLCPLYFPEGGYGIQRKMTVERINAWTGGWAVQPAARLLESNGQFDPWRDATVSAVDRPGGPLASTPDHPVMVISGGVHCSDYYKRDWDNNPEVKRTVDEEIRIMRRWVRDFYERGGEANERPNEHMSGQTKNNGQANGQTIGQLFGQVLGQIGDLRR